MSLLPGEKLDFSDSANKEPEHLLPQQINDKYTRGEVRIVTEQARYPLSTIVTMLDSGDYKLQPEFQRRHRWDVHRQSSLIESFIMNVPIPPIFLYEVEYSRYEVMDGLQRLTAIANFYKGEYALEGLDQWSELNGLRYPDLPEQVRRGIDRRYLSSIILLQETAATKGEEHRLKRLVFERINSGGEQLEPQESRNALYDGDFNRLCIKLARTESFCRMWGIPTAASLGGPSVAQQSLLLEEEDYVGGEEALPEFSRVPGEVPPETQRNELYRTMQDVELVLRFFAFRQIEQVEQGRMRDFFDEYLRRGNEFGAELLGELADAFTRTSDLVYEVLGDEAFFVLRPRANAQDGWVVFERPAKSAYDPIMSAFGEHLEQSGRLIERATCVRDRLKALYREQAEVFKGRFNKEDIRRRNELVSELLTNVLT